MKEPMFGYENSGKIQGPLSSGPSLYTYRAVVYLALQKYLDCFETQGKGDELCGVEGTEQLV